MLMTKGFWATTKRPMMLFAAVLFVSAAFQVGTARGQTSNDLKQTGTIEIDQVQVAFMLSGNLGGGKLHFDDKTHDFTVGGLGVGGIGASSIEAVGEIYNLYKLEDFEGAYGQARYGIAVVEKSAGELWLQNPAGVYIRVDAKRAGLALSLGADAVYIKLK
jgi:hypothetical protein